MIYFLNPDDVSLSKAAAAQGPILGDSGPLQWSKKAKTECRGVPQAEHLQSIQEPGTNHAVKLLFRRDWTKHCSPPKPRAARAGQARTRRLTSSANFWRRAHCRSWRSNRRLAMLDCWDLTAR